jgi:ankyrin repeat protein
LSTGNVRGAFDALKLGANPNGFISGSPMLRLAAPSVLSERLIALLLRFGAQPEILSSDGLDALQWCCTENHWLAACTLCEADHWPIDPRGLDARDSHGAHLACFAAATGRIGALRRMLGVRSDLARIFTPKGIDAFWHACESGNPQCARLLVQFCDPHGRYFDQSTPLIAACKLGDDMCIQTLLSKGANPNAYDEDGKTPLHWCAYSGSSTCVSMLCHAGSDPEQPDHQGSTPMELSLALRHFDVHHALVAQFECLSLSHLDYEAAQGRPSSARTGRL